MQIPSAPARTPQRFAPLFRPFAVAGLCAVVLFSTGCAKLESRDQMNKGVQAYKNQRYAEAVKHFQQAVNLDPTNRNAELYLATAYMVQWVPGADTPDNQKNYEMAQKEFDRILQQDPTNSLALGSLAFMAYNKASSGTPDQKHEALEQARKWNERRIQVNPNDPEPYYYLGVIDFDEVFPPIQTARVAEGMKATDPGPLKDPKVREDLRSKYMDLINQGIDDLKKCLAHDPQNENAMSYINLLLRRKANLEDNADEAKADIAQADQWFNKATEVQRIKATQPQKQQAQS
jgi:tetratricopeptide (TPR) repeat protein